jgi:hypothetical protein
MAALGVEVDRLVETAPIRLTDTTRPGARGDAAVNVSALPMESKKALVSSAGRRRR